MKKKCVLPNLWKIIFLESQATVPVILNQGSGTAYPLYTHVAIVQASVIFAF
jgi:hypothetical protein